MLQLAERQQSETRGEEERSSGASQAVALQIRDCVQDVRAAPQNSNNRQTVKQRDAPTRTVVRAALHQEKQQKEKEREVTKSATLQNNVSVAFTHRGRCALGATSYAFSLALYYARL